MPFRGHCIDIFSRGSDLQFDSRSMEIYSAVNLIDLALTRRVVGSFVARARMSDIKNLARHTMASLVRFLTGNDAARMHRCANAERSGE